MSKRFPIKDYATIALDSMKNRRLRSYLTILGILIGIAMIVALISIGQGMQDAVNEQFGVLGIDTITVEPGAGFSGGTFDQTKNLEREELDVVRRTRGVEEVAGLTFQSMRVEFKEDTEFTFVNGVPTDESHDVLESSFLRIEKGRHLKSSDKNKVLVGFDLARDVGIFEKKVKLRDKILINEKEFQVVGILKQIGNSQDDNSMSIPLETSWDLFYEEEEYNYMIAKVKSGYKPGDVAKSVEKNMRNHRDQEEGEEDFTVSTLEEIIGTFNIVLNVIQLALLGIAAISLVVGSIGIMNTMYTGVLERTREIGVMKAIGATNGQILFIFLIESGVYGLVGGGAGILIGLGFGKLVEIVAGPYVGAGLLKVSVSLNLILGALLLSFLLGAVAGVAPARQAAKLDPVEALRYE